jgi:hypothetical protein
MVMNETLIVSPEAFCPQIRSTKMSVWILNSFHVRPLANNAKGNVQGNVLQLAKHFASESLKTNTKDFEIFFLPKILKKPNSYYVD